MVPDLRTVYRKNGFFYNTTECTSGFGMMSDGVMETRFNQAGTVNRPGIGTTHRAEELRVRQLFREGCHV